MEKDVELEYKFDADHVDVDHFKRVMSTVIPDDFEQVTVADTFYRRGDSVVRHRSVDGASKELTIKVRKQKESLRERVEMNLRLSDSDPEGVRRFMGLAGFERLFTLDKTKCLIYTFNDLTGRLCGVEVALYTVGKRVGDELLQGTRTFIEVEVKGSIPQEDAVVKLDEWGNFLQTELKLAAPLNLSLFEHYSRT